MAKLRHIIPGFLAGEISAMLGGRVETEQYAYGLITCENFVPFNEGPLVKRPGFALICAADATSAWLTAFRRGVTQEYMLEWGEAQLRFFTNGGRIETSPGVAYEVTTPYTAAHVPAICAQQNFDRQYLAREGYAPRALRRDTAITFTLETPTLLNGPFADDNADSTITVTSSATSGAVTLTASSAIFAAGHVGALFRIEAKDLSDIKAWEPQMDGVAATDLCRFEGRVYVAASSGNTGTVPPTHTEGTEWDGQDLNDVINAKGPFGVQWTYVHDRFGIAQISAIGGGGTTATATVLRRLPNSVTTVATWRWAHAAFSDAAGWPQLVVLGKGRLNFFKDFEIVGSVVGDYGGGRINFAAWNDAGVLSDDLAFRRTISIEEPGLWVVPDRKGFLLGTPSREVAIGPINAAAAFSGTNITAEVQSYYGSELVFPVQTGTEALFIERGGKRLRSTDFDLGRDRYDAEDLTAGAAHIAGPGIIQLAWQRAPQALVYGVRSDGQLVVHSKSRLPIKGFSRTVLGGGALARSAVSIFGEDGRTEELWLLVERTAGDGETVLREIWKQEPWWALGPPDEDPDALRARQSEQFFVDAGVQISALAGQTEFTGLDHLAGQDVAVLQAGAVVTGCSVDASGVLTLERAPSDDHVLIVGLAYTATAVTLPPEIKFNGKSSQGLLQRVVKVATRVIETLGIKVGVPGGVLEEIIRRTPGDAMDAPIPIKTGDYGGEVEAEFDRLGRARWVSDVPCNAIVSAAMLEVDVSDTDV